MHFQHLEMTIYIWLSVRNCSYYFDIHLAQSEVWIHVVLHVYRCQTLISDLNADLHLSTCPSWPLTDCITTCRCDTRVRLSPLLSANRVALICGTTTCCFPEHDILAVAKQDDKDTVKVSGCVWNCIAAVYTIHWTVCTFYLCVEYQDDLLYIFALYKRVHWVE